MLRRWFKHPLPKFLKPLLHHSKPLIFPLLIVGTVYTISEFTIDPALRARNALLRADLESVQRRKERTAADIVAIRSEIERLQNETGESLYRARTDLGMVRSGEVIYQLVENRNQKPTDRRMVEP